LKEELSNSVMALLADLPSVINGEFDRKGTVAKYNSIEGVRWWGSRFPAWLDMDNEIEKVLS